jgi:nucleoside-diphosphate-sugar epimerase
MKALVTGGGGFLGKAIVKRLVERGDDVRSLSRHTYPELDRLGVKQIAGDIADPLAVEKAVEGCETVFHVAAKAGVWGPTREYVQTNISGTENVLKSCKRHSIERLVFTSSPSVAFAGHDEIGIDESAPLPPQYLTAYPATKRFAEQAVLAANGSDLATVALRPHLIWGPGDSHLIPRVLDRARRGKLRRVGDGKNVVDTTYIDNAAEAHLLAADRLAPGSPIAGKVYFISNGEPVNLWDFINRILDCAGLPPVTKSISARKACATGTVMELLYTVLPLPGEPPMTRFVAKQLSTSHWFDLTAARRDLGYQPRLSIEEGLSRLRESMASRR